MSVMNARAKGTVSSEELLHTASGPESASTRAATARGTAGSPRQPPRRHTSVTSAAPHASETAPPATNVHIGLTPAALTSTSMPAITKRWRKFE